MEGRIASGKALGFAAFAIGAWMYSSVTAGWYGMEMLGSSTWTSVLAFGTVALLVAALAAFLRDEGWHALFFAFWAAVFWGAQAGSQTGGPGAYGAWYFFGIAVFTLLLWARTLKVPDIGTSVALVALGTGLAFVGWTLAAWGLGTAFAVIGGYVGLLAALASFWAAADALGVVSSPKAGAGDGSGESRSSGGGPGSEF